MTPEPDAPVYILGVKAERFMFVDVLDVAVSPTGITQFSGGNAQGKTGGLTAIEATLCGGAAIPEMAVQAGAERAETEIPIGGPDGKPLFVARRVYRDGGTSSLEVRAADGSKQASPQKLLDSLMDTKFFNPVKFASPGMRTQAADNQYRLDVLFGLCPLKLDLPAHDAEAKRLFDERAATTKRVKELEAVVKDAVATAAPDGAEEDETALVGEIAKAENSSEIRATAARRVKELDGEIADVEAQIAKLQQRAKLLAEEWARQGNVAQGAGTADPAPLKAKLAEVRARNAARRGAVADRARAEERAKTLQGERARADVLSAKIEAMGQTREAAIKDAAFPLPQLTISSDGWLSVRKKDGEVIPFHQESTAKRTLAGFVIFAATKPRLRACVVPNGNDLDNESLMQLAKLSKRFGIPCFLERIVGNPEAGAVIEFRGGKVVAQTPAGVAP